MKKGKFGIWGWWQGNNLGDNWIKKTLSYYFPKADFLETTVSDFDEYDFVLCGGGGLFIYDVIFPWDKPTKKPLKNTAFGIFGMGAEFPHDSNKAVELYKKSRFFFVRDQYSLDCMHLSNIERSYDVTFSKPLKRVEYSEVNSDKLFFVWRDGQELIKNEKFKNYIRRGSSKEEWDLCLREHFTDIIEDDFQTDGDDIEERIEGCGFVVSGRYHGIVAAIQKGLPFIAIDICPKIRALVTECGLEEYCIKISEIDKVDKLIEKAKKNVSVIREKEYAYCDLAYSTLLKQIDVVRLEVLKSVKPLSVIHYGSYWMGDNDVVNVMADDLKDCCNLTKIDLKAYKRRCDSRIKEIRKTPNGTVSTLDEKKVLKDCKRKNADVIILNSGGLTLEDSTFEKLKEEKIISVGLSLSDPDVYPYNGAIYADKFQYFYTNSKYSFEKQYDHSKVNINIMPFAASVKHHFYMPEVKKEYDLVVVGHAREDRLSAIDRLSRFCKVGTYGKGWKKSLGVVNGQKHVEAINSGKMYLSFARTVAGFDNVKVGLFEAMACNQVVITSYMEELQAYFDIGKEIICYRDEDELVELVKYYTEHEEEREKVRQLGYRRFLQEHTYVKRWNDILRQIYVDMGCYEDLYEVENR